jgi:hypothetical protein
MVPSGVTLLGIVKHLAFVERAWFQRRFAGRDVPPTPRTPDDPDPDFRIEPHETTQEIIDLYVKECAISREIASEASPDDLAASAEPDSGGRTGFSLRWILTHMIEETARHNGHADIFREMIDGSTGD